jgi:hypothetical protein
MRVVRRSVEGEDPAPGRPQGCAPTMDEFGKELRRAGKASGEAILTDHPTPPQGEDKTTPPQGEDKPSPLLWTGITTHSCVASGFFKRMGLSRI